MLFKVVAAVLGTAVVVGGGVTAAHYWDSIVGTFGKAKKWFNDSRKTKIWLDNAGKCQSEEKNFGGYVANGISNAVGGSGDVCSRVLEEGFDWSSVEIDSSKMDSKYNEVKDKDTWKAKVQAQSTS